MSFLYLKRFSSSFTSRFSNEVEEGNNEEDYVPPPFDVPRSAAPPVEMDDEFTFGLPSDASLTDHEVITGFPPGTLGEVLFRVHHQQDHGSCGGTILSSTPSDEQVVFPPPPNEETHQLVVWPVVAPISLADVRSVLSIPTIESEYRNWQSLENSLTFDAGSSSDDFSFELDLSSLPSLVVHSSSCNEGSQCALVVHGETAAYRNVADRLIARQANDDTWHSRFTEQDWIDFRIAAKMVLQALDPSPPSLALPPPVPTLAQTNEVPRVYHGQYNLHDFLPEAFLCCLCQDVIVGATTLSCACDKSTVCAECWESYFTLVVEPSGFESFVRVETRNTCPSCEGTVHSSVPCHALDVAIFHAIKSIPEPLQHAYYIRLDQWRKEVIRRRQVQSDSQSPRHELILAELIQQEEEIFWSKHNDTSILANTERALLFLGEVAVCVTLASLSAAGFSMLGRRS